MAERTEKMGISGLLKEYAAAARRLVPSGTEYLIAILVGLLGGVAAMVVQPLVLVGGFAAAVALLAIPFKGYKVFWLYLIFLLLGYLLLGKGFAYVGAAPIYVAEIGLALAAISVLVLLAMGRMRTWDRLLRPEVVFLLIFMAWQALCTVPFLGVHGVSAVRDAALWGYALFAIFILLLVPRESVKKLFVIYGKVLPYFLVWLLVAWVFVKVSPLDFRVPGSPTPLLHLKSGDVGVHLAGAAAFMLLRFDLRGVGWSSVKLWSLWGLWLANWIAWGASNRGGMFSALLGIGATLLLRPKTQWYRPLVLVAALALVFIAGVNGPSFKNDKVTISSDQIIANVTSTFGEESASSTRGTKGLEQTKEWRLNWWSKIVGYTFGGEHFWSGKGYGVNLANNDGFQVQQKEESLRSPHNVFMTILARSGVPGLILWLLFLVSFGSMLVKKALVGRSGDSWNKRYALWLLVYWLAFLLNASFDVFLEGPMGGVLFWSLVGISLVYCARDTGDANHLETKQGVPRPPIVRRTVRTG